MGSGFAVNALFSDHMVLQRGKPVPVWGTAADGATVTVAFGAAAASAVASGGRWQAELPALAASAEPRELTVGCGAETIVLRDVLVGDVWLAGGQSNMQWTLLDSADPEREIAAASHPLLRYYEVPRVAWDDGVAHHPAWKRCEPAAARDFSAVAYHFARELIGELDVPIGIVGCNWGGTSASCWVREADLADHPPLDEYLTEYRAVLADSTPEKLEAEVREYDARVVEYTRRFEAGLQGEELGDYPWPPPMSQISFMRPYGLYGTMLSLVPPFALKGFIYYQGESDTHKPTLYDRLLTRLVARWRADWTDETLPFLFVQLTSYGNGNADGEEYALLRESQQIVAETVPHTAMTVILDCGDLLDIHPKDKRTVGERLVRSALHTVYGKEVADSGPVLRSFEPAADGRMTLRFDHAGDGGLAARDGELRRFQAAGADGVYRPAQAAVRGVDEVEVWSADVPEPVAVRYAWANYPDANLVNGDGLPAGPFRTDRTGR